jgi:Na+/H+ antiporter NhaC
MRCKTLYLLLIFLLLQGSKALANPGIEPPSVILSGLNSTFSLQGIESSTIQSVTLNGQAIDFESIAENQIRIQPNAPGQLVVETELGQVSLEINVLPAWTSVLPPLIAILLALLLKEVLLALFLGILGGAFLVALAGGAGFFDMLLNGFTSSVDTYLIQALNDESHLSIIVFSLLIGVMVALITFNGGMKGIVEVISRWAKNARSGQLATYFMGIAIFFDDYANTLVVGNTMRPLMDRLRVSREKLAYIVDSTAAPVAAVAFITTWIGAELSYIQDGLDHIQLSESAYAVFIQSLQFSFYPLLTLIFVGMLIWSGKEFGPMLKAERRLLSQDSGLINATPIEVVSNGPNRWYNALIPVFTIVFLTVFFLIRSGIQNIGWDDSLGFSRNLSAVLGASDTYRALLWSSSAGVIVAMLLTWSQRLAGVRQTAEVFIEGIKSMMTAMIILVLAWALASVTEALHTAEFLTHLLSETNLAVQWMPAITFITAGLIAFATGTSWGTMAILYPLVIPAVWAMTVTSGLSQAEALPLLYQTISVVLAGAVMGDHCSPISDTTIMSSLATSCDHIEHVRTQMPYALTVGGVSLVAGIIPSAFGLPAYAGFIIAIIVFICVDSNTW